MKVALFGETGFIGKQVAAKLREQDIDFFGVSRHATLTGSYRADISDFNSLDVIKENADVVIICSSALPKPQYQQDDIPLYININILGIHNILKWSRTHGVKKVIYCSTLSMIPPGKIDENPLIDVSSHYLYKITKAAGEHMVYGFCREHGIASYCLRIASVYGPGMKKDIIELIAGKIKDGEKIIIHNDSFTVDFIHVSDVAKSIVACISDNHMNGIMNIASGNRIKLKALAEIIGNILSKKPEIEIQSDNSIPPPEYSIKRMRKLIGNQVIPLDEGLCDLFRQNNPS